MKKSPRSLDLAVAACCVALLSAATMAKVSAQTAAPAALEVPAKTIPVPTDVSPQLQKIIAAPLRSNWNIQPKTGEEWKPVADAGAAALIKNVPGMLERLKVKVEKTTIDGVRAYIVTPETISPENRNRQLIHMHGGCYVLNPGDAGLPEAIFMAGFGHIKVISVDYRMPPEAYFPAALDDGITVWKAALKTMDSKNMAIFGTSAGGSLTLEMVLKAKELGLPLPGAIAPGTPMSDVTKVGDTFYTNAMLDNVLVSPDGFCDAGTKVYANGHDMKDPLLSPVYGDMKGFPPAILTSGTRDLLLSNTVRVHRKLRQAGVEATLQVYEGMSHAHYARDDTAPESKEVFEEIAAFFDKHLGKINRARTAQRHRSDQNASNGSGALPARFGFFGFEGTNSEHAAKPAVSATPGSRDTMAATMAPSISNASWWASTSGSAAPISPASFSM
jgi:monoterpene epsilon-lactone hydrolase